MDLRPVIPFGVALTPLALLIAFGETDEDSRFPPAFVDLAKAIPNLQLDLRYAGHQNFVGKPIEGYEASKALATREAAAALAGVQQDLQRYGLGLKIFDAYRPQRAVQHFVRWAKRPNDDVNRAAHYPNIPKDQLIPLGYIADQSSHSRGSAVDLTVIQLSDGIELDMGTPFDYFDSRSHAEAADISSQQRANRLLLRSLMEKHGFVYYAEEWWHFRLAHEPFPDTTFNFPIR